MEIPIVIIKTFVGSKTTSFNNCRLTKGDLVFFSIAINKGSNEADKANSKTVNIKLSVSLLAVTLSKSGASSVVVAIFGNNVNPTRKEDTIKIKVNVPLTSTPSSIPEGDNFSPVT